MIPVRRIGILLDPKIYKNGKLRRQGHEHLIFYRRAARKLGLKIEYMTLEKRHLRGAPSVIHNRSIPKNKHQQSILQKLAKRSIVFNRSRLNKQRVHQLLSASARLRIHLPATKRLNRNNLQDMMRRYHALYLKPSVGSVGLGILRIRKIQGSKSWSVQVSRSKVKRVTKSRLYSHLKRKTGSQAYLIQKQIPLAKVHGCPYDIRVSVQKGRHGRWQITGMVAKVAKKGSHVTNVARGGSVLSAKKAFRESGLRPELIEQRLKRLSLLVARTLDRNMRGIADLGLDIGISKTGFPYLIEVNFRDQRYSFKEAGMNKTFYATYANPMKYAKYLLETLHLRKNKK